ncbi:hypothetical protein VE01_07433 [Pseudogymnoascus verrucosus]|uniref:HNH nuclease domain-containing protein n=1 Tax=Pseudogymnoascus verrucosus TaxID=342668 RepID=A0A1B8GGT3_9PEZI|nr:uncharacterized protein VE01_07433 [Pseudogymnoascus verrucosus]OBT95023.1 hypothetical protein VE01_07433 [Pseudogymnoascus verrucosus]
MGLFRHDISLGSEFIESKIRKISAELTGGNHDTAKGSKSTFGKKERELVILKRQKKAMADDVDEALQRYPTVEGAYSSALLTKVISASIKWKNAPEQRLYADGVLSYYKSVKPGPSGNVVEKYCHLNAQWLHGMCAKCVHIVPKSLESDELAYLFGVREVDLSEPRNGITLETSTHEALEKGWIVIVPDKPRYGGEAIWRCIVVQKSMTSNLLYCRSTWKDIDGRPLEFLNSNRPARRYLYLRYVMTYLQQQRLGNVEWFDDAKARGYHWGLPGPYLRKSMLIALARRFSDQGLPECFYESTFTVADGSPQRSAEEENDLAMALYYKMQDDYAEVTGYREEYSDKSDGDESDDDESDDDETDDDEWGDDSDSEEETSDGRE